MTAPERPSTGRVIEQSVALQTLIAIALLIPCWLIVLMVTV